MDYYKNNLGSYKKKRSLLMKKYFLITLMIFISLFVFAQEQTNTNNNEKYQITEIEYNLAK